MTLFTRRGATMPILLALLATLLCPSIAQQQQYEVHDDNSAATPDYTKYYAPGTTPEEKTAAAADDSAGFVRPIDFSALFGAASGISVFGGVPAARTAHQVFSPAAAVVEANPFQLVQPGTAGLFPVAAVQGKNSEGGFTNPAVQFQSFFDASGAAASEVGFRPQDFLKPAASAPQEDREAEEAGYYAPSYAKTQDQYESRPGPSYTYKAVPAATSYRNAPASYRDAPATSYRDSPATSYRDAPSPSYRDSSSAEEEDDDDEEEHESSYRSSYEPKQKTAAAPDEKEAYSFKPVLKVRKSEYLSDIGKSSYPAPAEKYNYEYVPPAAPVQTKSSYQPSAAPESKASYPATSSDDYYPSKVHQKSTPVDIYDKPAVYRPSGVGHRHTDTSDIIYGKGKAPAYRRTEEPHEGKSSYPAPAQYSPKKTTAAYYDPKERAPVQFTPKEGSEERKSPKVKEEDDDEEREIEEEEEETREEEEKEPAPNLHGPPEYAPSGSKTNKKSCKKIDKRLTADDVAKGRFRRDAMTCYVCDDPKTGGTFEQCSYTSDPKSRSYFVGRAQKYSTADSSSKPTPYRYRRYLGDHPFGEELETVETLARFARELPKENYYFTPEYITSERGDDVQYKPAGSSIDKKNCKKVKKDSLTCMVCKDPKTGGDYEQCSYSEKPKENNYFVARQSSFSTGKKSPKSEERYVGSPHDAYSSRPRSRHTREKPDSFPSSTEVKSEEDKESESPYRYGSSDEGSEESSDKEGEGSELHLTGQSYDEYFSRLFPELQGRSEKDSEKYSYPSERKAEEEKKPVYQYKSPLPDYFADTAHKKDLERVLGEFRQKDRSSCKKVMRDKMTCYKCVDKKGMQHEECMFVAASEPKKSHLAYHEVKEFRLTPPPGVKAPDSDSSSTLDSGRTADTKSDDSTTSAPTTSTTTPKPKRKSFFKKVTTSTTTPTPDSKYDESAEKLELLRINAKDKAPGVKVKVTRRSSKASTLSATTTLTTPSSLSKREQQDAIVSASEQKSQKVKSTKSAYKPDDEEPQLSEEDLSPDGLYTAETRDKFDPILKITLPAYMLERSEHEAIFDEVMASGRRR